MKKWFRILLPVVVLAAGLGIGIMLMATGPEAQRQKPPVAVPVVEVMTLTPEDFRVVVRTRGTVLPRTQSTLIPEVAGRVVWIAPTLRSGGFFEKDEELLGIDPTNYENAVTISRADLARARLAMAQEEAQSAQAQLDWGKLGLSGDPSELTLRRPQLENARAEVAAAEARLHQAEADMSRTRIRAPYAGRVLEKQVDVGQYVSPGTVLATVYAVDYVEIRLPLTDNQTAFVDLPERYRGDDSEVARRAGSPVTLNARIGRDTHSWQAMLVRTDGAIDTESRQLFVVAQVDDPYSHRGDAPPLKIGQFVEAEILGHTLTNVFVLPRSALDTGNRALIVSQDRRLERRAVEVLWRDGERVVVSSGLATGERISLTPMPFATDGVVVRIPGEEPAAGKRHGPSSKAEGQGL